MPILKNIKVDDIEDVTVMVIKDISFRTKKFKDGGCHIIISDADKTKDEVMVDLNETESLCWSDKATHIDMIIDCPNNESLDFLITFLTDLRKEISNEMPTM